MTRYTRKDINELMDAMCHQLGVEFSTESVPPSRAIYLDYNPTYGGYQIRQSMGIMGSRSYTTITDRRFSPSELANHISFSLAMVNLSKKEEKHR
jgi:hypothetical protein